jgi:aspartate ammonia-lyase
MASFRIEKDSLGEMKIPDTADYGIHTARAVENYPITGILLNHYPEANLELGAPSPKIANAIIAACEQIIAGEVLRARHAAGPGRHLHTACRGVCDGQSFGVRSARRKMI